ncbi:MAG: serine hydroxymethyltransferase [Candidatus Zixiibacteriota bacterium]
MHHLEHVKKADREVFEAIRGEENREAFGLELIASENYPSIAVMEATGCVMTNKYAEGYPGKRYYGGCEFVDMTENMAIERAKKLFGAEHANVQPHAGSQANMAVYFSLMNPGDKLFGLKLAHGGHLTHGHKVNFSGKIYDVGYYGVDKETEMLDYDKIAEKAEEFKPKVIMTGASAYPRIWDFKKFREIADNVGAVLVADIAHIAGLVAAGLHPNPFPHCEVVTTTTHKTLRGPRGGLILMKDEYKKKIDKTVMPGMQGGPLCHVIAAKAIAFGEAMKPEFKEYQKQVLANAMTLAKKLEEKGLRLVSGGTDNHLLLVDLRPLDITGKIGEETLDKAAITVNKNTIPFDPQKPFIASGIRIGTPAITSRGMKEAQMEEIGELIYEVLSNYQDDGKISKVKKRVEELCKEFPIYPELIDYK